MGIKKQNWLKKHIQVEVCIYNKFGGFGLSCFGDLSLSIFSQKHNEDNAEDVPVMNTDVLHELKFLTI